MEKEKKYLDLKATIKMRSNVGVKKKIIPVAFPFIPALIIAAIVAIQGFCTAMSNGVLGLYFGATAYASPGTWYLGYATGVAADGTITGEPAGTGNYSRVSITNNTSNWNSPSGGAVDNKVAFEFPEASASQGEMDTAFLSTSASGGTALAYGPFAAAKTPDTGLTPRFVAGALDIVLTDTP